jgi:hypothetical protein
MAEKAASGSPGRHRGRHGVEDVIGRREVPPLPELAAWRAHPVDALRVAERAVDARQCVSRRGEAADVAPLAGQDVPEVVRADYVAVEVPGLDVVDGELAGVHDVRGHQLAIFGRGADEHPGGLGPTIVQVSDLDLSYTPPLGSPWDAVQAGAPPGSARPPPRSMRKGFVSDRAT